MNATLPLTLAHALAAAAPPSSIVHRAIGEAQAKAIDEAMYRLKNDPHSIQKLADRLTRDEAQIRHAMARYSL